MSKVLSFGVFRHGRYFSARLFITRHLSENRDSILDIVKRFDGFCIFEKQRLASREQPIIFKLDFPFDIEDQSPQVIAKQLAILDQCIRIKLEMKGYETIGNDAIVRSDLGIPAAGKNSVFETTNF